VLQGYAVSKKQDGDGKGFPVIEGSVDEVSPEMMAQARKNTASHANNADELRLFLDMLGLMPGSPPLKDSRTVSSQMRQRQTAPLTTTQKERKRELRQRKFLLDKWKSGDPLSDKELSQIGKLFAEYPDLK
jgi:hypothetical protein